VDTIKKNKIKYLFPIITDPTAVWSTKEDLDRFIQNAETFLLVIAGIVVVSMFIYSGILYVTSGGSDERIGKAKQALTAAVIGLIIVVGAPIIIALLQYFLGA
jgi:hypothetical protein